MKQTPAGDELSTKTENMARWLAWLVSKVTEQHVLHKQNYGFMQVYALEMLVAGNIALIVESCQKVNCCVQHVYK